MTEAIIPLISLIALEVILGIDNIIFISILADKLPEDQRNKLRYWGIGLAMVMRLALLPLSPGFSSSTPPCSAWPELTSPARD